MDYANEQKTRALEHRKLLGHSQFGVKANGQVWNIKHDRPMKHVKAGTRFQVALTSFGGTVTYAVAMVVVSAWLGVPIGRLKFKLIGYKDGNKLNTHPDNLVYTGHIENYEQPE